MLRLELRLDWTGDEGIFTPFPLVELLNLGRPPGSATVRLFLLGGKTGINLNGLVFTSFGIGDCLSVVCFLVDDVRSYTEAVVPVVGSFKMQEN